MVLIMIVGLPASGKTTVVNQIQTAFEAGGTAVYPMHVGESLNYNIYRWVASGSHQVGIIDGNNVNVFQRQEVLSVVDEARQSIPGREIFRVAMFVDTPGSVSRRRCQDRGPDHAARFSTMVRKIQQPIYEEGFDLIHRWNGRTEFDPKEFIDRINERLAVAGKGETLFANFAITSGTTASNNGICNFKNSQVKTYNYFKYSSFLTDQGKGDAATNGTGSLSGSED